MCMISDCFAACAVRGSSGTLYVEREARGQMWGQMWGVWEGWEVRQAIEGTL
jgi:hypothetical protein